LGLRDWKAPDDIDHRVYVWRNGFIAASYAIYDAAHTNSDEYISDFVRYYRCSWLNASLSYFNHEFTFRAFLMQAGVKQPDTVGLVGHGRFLLDPLSQEGRYVSATEFEDMLRADGGRFVVKPETGNWGYGIFLLNASGGSLFRQRGRIREPFHISDLPYVAIVERLVQQGDFWRFLFRTVQTRSVFLLAALPGIRVLRYWNRIQDIVVRAFMSSPMHRYVKLGRSRRRKWRARNTRRERQQSREPVAGPRRSSHRACGVPFYESS